jgi:radical SAM superfamily enzyme YgiQ (UPF0313 family)
MKITFVRPHITSRRAADAIEPLAFGILARLTPPDVELALYDDRIEPIPYDEPTDLVALTVETFTAKRAYQIAAQYRRRGVPVVMGGYHPTLLPTEASQYADAIAIGDAETIWPRIVADARAGRLRRFYQSPPDLAVEGVSPRRSLFASKGYAGLRITQFGRGCRFACDFCSIHAFYGRAMPRRCLEDVLIELDELRGQYVFFADDNLFNDKQQAEALFRRLKGYHMHWACQTSLDIVQYPYLLDLMAESGCVGVLIGFETLSESSLAQMKKKWNTQQGSYTDSLAKIYERGMMVFGSFMFGYDYDTPDVFERTLEFAMQSKLALAQFNTVTPFPGTPLYERLKKNNRLLFERWWLHDDYRYGDTIYQPKNMTPEELRDQTIRLRHEFNTYEAIARRMFAPKMNAHSIYNLFAFLAINLVSKKEIRNKLGTPLGDGSSFSLLSPLKTEEEFLSLDAAESTS